jgi:hypothetical protein
VGWSEEETRGAGGVGEMTAEKHPAGAKAQVDKWLAIAGAEAPAYQPLEGRG